MSEEGGFDPTKRRLCPDGSCIGILGPDGKCGECGRVGGPATGDAGGPEAAEPPAFEADVRDDDSSASAAVAAPAAGNGGFDPARRLCDDGTCVGVIGADGKCAVCGRVSGS